jgi:3',5'-cyclic-AMP phosphodiesterase
MPRILQITDLHFMEEPTGTLLGVATEKYFRMVLEHAYQHHASFDLILLTGDLAQETCPASYQRIQKIVDHYQTSCLCLPGNHDDYALMQQYLNSGHLSCKQQLQLSNWQIICLNSQIPGEPGGFLSDNELALLVKHLKSNPQCYTLIALHHHCISCDSSWMDTMITRNHADLMNIIDAHPKVKAVIFGHIHQEMNKNHNHIHLLGTPASCFQFLPLSTEFALDSKPPGYRIIELNPDGSLYSNVEWLPVTLDELQRNDHGY